MQLISLKVEYALFIKSVAEDDGFLVQFLIDVKSYVVLSSNGCSHQCILR